MNAFRWCFPTLSLGAFLCFPVIESTCSCCRLSRSVRRHEARLIDDMNEVHTSCITKKWPATRPPWGPRYFSQAQKLSQGSEEFAMELQQLLRAGPRGPPRDPKGFPESTCAALALSGSAREANSAGEAWAGPMSSQCLGHVFQEEWKQEAHKLEEKVRHFAMFFSQTARGTGRPVILLVYIYVHIDK